MNLDELAIISECYADICLIETLISARITKQKSSKKDPKLKKTDH